MSEYQRYEFMTSDRPLTPAQLAEVRTLSSHIEASSSHALIEYHWGDFKHDPLNVLYRYFDGFLYWTNWSEHRLAFRFPHGVLPANFLDGYDFGEYVTLTPRATYDLLDIHFTELEPLDDWVEYELGPLMPLREELMDGDPRPLYILWLAARNTEALGGWGDRWGERETSARSPSMPEVIEGVAPPTPAGLGALTAAQRALGDLLLLPEQIIQAAAQHSPAPAKAATEDLAASLDLLPGDRQRDYLSRLMRNEPGLSHQLIHELRALRPEPTQAAQPRGPHVAFAQLLTEAREVKARMERERQEQERQARLRRLREIQAHPDDAWRRVTEAVERGSGAGYDEAIKGLVALCDAAREFDEVTRFEERFRSWVPPHSRRRAFVRRLVDEGFTLPEE